MLENEPGGSRSSPRWRLPRSAVPPALRNSHPLRNEAAVPDGAELERRGAIIGEVLVYPENIFDLEDPKENKALYRLANRVHVRTQPHVIRQQLLFKSGDRYSQRLLDESARILRSARYIYDASVQPVAFRNGRVDVAVTTRDVWTLNPGMSFSRSGGKNSTGFELEELNLLGTGTDLSIARKSGVDRDSTLFEYKDRHLFNSWVSVQAAYASNSDGSLRSLDLERPFYSLDSRWSTRLTLLEDEHTEPLYDLGKVVDEFGSHRRLASAAWGWSRGLENGWVRRWSVGATFDQRQFSEVAGSISRSLMPEDRKLIYPWLGFELVQDDFDRFSESRSDRPHGGLLSRHALERAARLCGPGIWRRPKRLDLLGEGKPWIGKRGMVPRCC